TTCGAGPSASCANTAVDPANCGGCDAACALPNVASGGCAAGACTVVRCAGGRGDCDGAAPNGCETDLNASASNCGGCGRACALANATATCAAGACAVASCAAGFADCNANPADGCEVDTRSDNAHCGGCSTACAAGRVCSGGACGATCAAPLTTCGAGASAFCANTAIDPSSCGGCGAACALPNVASGGCAAGACTVVACAGGFGNCDGVASNGCETNTLSSAASCGACGRTCALPHASAACTAGSCAIAACAAGFVDCNANPADGCEVDARTDNANCGACAAACAGGTSCAAGACAASCMAPQVSCNGTCASLASDPRHCGACGNLCSSAGTVTAYCAAGACGFICAANFADCDGAPGTGCETDLRTTAAHCGACGRACVAIATCGAGACVCPAGLRTVGTGCVALGAVPRLVAPVSLGDTTQRRPTLRWELPAGFDGAAVELCRDRLCELPVETIAAVGNSARPTADLAARSVVFWRVRGRVGTTADTVYSPTWLFHVPAVSSPSGVDTSGNPHLDVNGDGYDDVAVGARGGNPGGRLGAGYARVYHGGPAGIPATAARVLAGGAAGDNLGAAVANAGDVNGDGYADLLVGASLADPGGRVDAGTVSVFLGSATGIGPTAARVLEGAAGDNLGISVACAGDVNNDSYADIIVGAPLADPGGRADVGGASVFLGGPTGIGPTAVRSLEGTATNDRFGWSVAGAGDGNGDGYSDVVVGAYLADPGGRSGAGTASVFHGGAGGTAASAARVYEGAVAADWLGWSVAGAGDVNGDGYGDLVLGAQNATRSDQFSAGIVTVFHGGPTGFAASAARSFQGNILSRLGNSVAGAGDVDGDGYADLFVGAPTAPMTNSLNGLTGNAKVYAGSASGITTNLLFFVEGAMSGFNVGFSVASAGDVNRDGYPDLLVGAPAADMFLNGNRGTTMVYQGTGSFVPGTPTRELYGDESNDRFGHSVASRGGLRRARLWCAVGRERRSDS
ncbi:MAG: uncharacterized protein JWM10_407, partial [Myxococcaceae bacterium]|nr:uncharacterized protein [Myxococcaceae bacterium]